MAHRVSWLSLGPIPRDVPPEGYTYRCEDLGILKPWLYRFFVTPLSKITPASVAANDITILAALCSFAPIVVFQLFAGEAPGWVQATIPALGLFLYVVLDHLDGTHARRTGTSSPLGELLDHWFDGVNGGLVTFGVALAWNANGPVMATLVALGTLAYALAMSEQKATGVLRLDRMSGNEGMALICCTNLLIGVLGQQRACELPLWGGYTLAHLFQFLCGLGCVGTCKNVFLRSSVRRTMPDCMPIVVAGVLVVTWSMAGLDGRVAAWIVTLAGAICSGRLVLARTTGLVYKWDGLGLGALALGVVATLALHPDPVTLHRLGLVVACILGLRALGDVIWAIEALARFVRRGEVLALFVPARAAETAPERERS
jgi:phosphatidylglycerophosphate synthase